MPEDDAGQGALNLPPPFWTLRPALALIRQAAHSRARSADATLAVVLARVAAMLPPAKINTGVGTPASLNFFTAIVGVPGTGKSDAWEIAKELYPRPVGSEEWFADNLPLGTGEGIAEAYMGEVELVPSPGQGTKTSTRRQQVRSNAFFFADEGKAMTALLERSGATVGETLRSGWKGVTLGQTNGKASTSRHVENYALGFAVGFQPETSRPLLRDVDAGTPQRFVFVNAIDPYIPDTPPSWPSLPKWYPDYAPGVPWTLEDAQRDAILERDRNRNRRTAANPYDAHDTLTQTKIAGLLAALDMRKAITDEDFLLAATIWETSCAVRDSLLVAAQAEAAAREEAGHKRAARRELVIEESKEGKAFEIAIGNIARHVARAECEGGCKRRCLTQAIAHKYRQMIDVENAIDEAVTRGLIRRDGDAYR